jgi:hypothetical protein
MSNLFATYVTNFIGRLDGPLHFRFFMQPLMAIVLAFRDGRRDARAGRTAYVWTFFHDPAQRRYLLIDGWKGISRVFILAVVLDVIYQLIEWRTLRPVGALLTAIILAVIPYVILRGPFNRLVRLARSLRKDT